MGWLIERYQVSCAGTAMLGPVLWERNPRHREQVSLHPPPCCISEKAVSGQGPGFPELFQNFTWPAELQRVTVHQLVHSLSGHNSQEWTRLKPRTSSGFCTSPPCAALAGSCNRSGTARSATCTCRGRRCYRLQLNMLHNSGPRVPLVTF